MKLYIKNMVCERCKLVVKNELLKLGLHPVSVELGEVELLESMSAKQQVQFNDNLRLLGFEQLDDKKSRIIEKIKNEIVKLVHHNAPHPKTNFSTHIQQQLNHDYSYLSTLFSTVEGVTIEQYFITQKIERVKELLVYDELSLSEIAVIMHYSSVANLSRQFKKITGLTPTHFKQLKELKRIPIEQL